MINGFKLLLFLLGFIFSTINGCKTTVQRSQGEDPNLPNFEMLDEKVRLERYQNSKLIQAKGPVITNCNGRPCTMKELKTMTEDKIQSFPRYGEWEHYEQILEQNPNNLRERYFVVYLGMKGRYENNKREGIWKGLNKEGKIITEIPYVNGYKHGIQKNFDDQGNLIGEIQWVEDKKEGVSRTYDPKEKIILSETHWKNDKKEGPYYKNIISYQKDVLRNGLEYTVHKLEEGQFQDDKEEGEWKYYDPNYGYLKKTITYVKGEKQGIETNFHPNGSIASQGMNQNNARVGVWKFYFPTGELQMEGSFSATQDPENPFKRTGIWKEYYKNGKLFAEGMRDHIRIGVWSFYNPNGTIRIQGKMANESMLESAEVYDENGRIVSEGKLLFSLISYDPDKDSIKLNLKPDLPHTYYHPNGTKRLVIRSQTDAIEYNEKGKEIGRGGADAQGRKQGCWTENGKKMLYMLGNPRPSLTANACK